MSVKWGPVQNASIVSFIYGQILHYALDTTMHPYVYYMTNDVQDIGFITFHMVFEEYIGIYLCRKVLQKERRKVQSDFYTNFHWKEDSLLIPYINEIYEKTYGIKNAIFAQRLTERVIKAIDTSTYFMQENNGKAYLNFIGLKRYLKRIQMTEEEITNEMQETWYYPITGEKANYSVIQLVEQAINLGQELIDEVNKVLYDGKNITSLEKVFPNLSYDTGLNCEIGKPWTRSRIKDRKRM